MFVFLKKLKIPVVSPTLFFFSHSGLDTNVDWSDGSRPIARGGSSLGTGLSAIALSYAIGPAMPSSLNALRRPHMFPVAAVGAHGIACLASVAYAAVAFSAVGGTFPRHLASAVAPSAALNAAAALRAASLVLAALVVVHPVLRGLEDALEGRDCGDTEASGACFFLRDFFPFFLGVYVYMNK
jgi:hypothetical protein